jgi:uncharacterized protein (DUF2267 family)
MAHTTHRLSTVETSLEETYDWLDHVAFELGNDDRHLALAVLRAVLHAVRDHLTIEQTAHFSAQFPIFIRGLYFERWTPDAPRNGRSAELFVARIESELEGYGNKCEGGEAARAVFAVLEENVSGSAEKIRLSLPEPIRDLWF